MIDIRGQESYNERIVVGVSLMLVSMMARLNAAAMSTNAAYAGMQGKQALLSLTNQSSHVANASFGNEFQQIRDLKNLLRQEQNITFGMRQNELLYKISELQYQAWKKVQDENIKRSFSTFA